jgi:YHS domain-containing protein
MSQQPSVPADGCWLLQDGSTLSPCSFAGEIEMDTKIDPVCGMTVEIGKAADKADFGDATYFFCSKHCGNAV